MKKVLQENKFYLWGGGGHAKVVLDILYTSFSKEQVAGVFDDDPAKKGMLFYSSKIIGKISDFEGEIDNLIIAIGNNQTRKEKSILFKEKIKSYGTAVHPSAEISTTVKIGPGTVIMPSSLINADTVIGEHVIINSGAIIEHDCIINDFVHVAPGVVVTGGVTIGELSFIGANTTIIPGIKIGSNCIIGAGSVVTKDIPNNTISYGSPAKVKKVRK